MPTTSTAAQELPQRVDMRQLKARLGFDSSTIARWYKAGTFPAPHYIAGCGRWWLHEVLAWEAQNVTDKSSKDPRK